MDFITSPTAIAEWTARARRGRSKVGFVPTMGALHEGHLQLVETAVERGDQVVCSIFVNPLQFNNAEDLRLYPRQLEQDRELLRKAGCHALFAPVKEGLFADFSVHDYALGGLDDHWEGPSRPGHFNGVVNVVERLFHFVRPDFAFFGEKDRQQLTILQFIARTNRWPEQIVPCSTVRASDGLALSSRNARMNETERQQATILHKALRTIADHAFSNSVDGALTEAKNVLAQEPEVVLDYLAIVDALDLRPLSNWGERSEALALIAAQVGPVRLIDNIKLTR